MLPLPREHLLRWLVRLHANERSTPVGRAVWLKTASASTPGTVDEAAGGGNVSRGVVAAAEEVPAPAGPPPAPPGDALRAEGRPVLAEFTQGLADDAGVGEGPVVTVAPDEDTPDSTGGPPIATGTLPNAAGAPGALGVPPGAMGAPWAPVVGGRFCMPWSLLPKKLRCPSGRPRSCWCFLLSRQGRPSAGRGRQRRRSPKFPGGRRKWPGSTPR